MSVNEIIFCSITLSDRPIGNKPWWIIVRFIDSIRKLVVVTFPINKERECTAIFGVVEKVSDIMPFLKNKENTINFQDLYARLKTILYTVV